MTNYYQINYTNMFGKRRARGINATTLEEAIDSVEFEAVEGTMTLTFIDDTPINWKIN